MRDEGQDTKDTKEDDVVSVNLYDSVDAGEHGDRRVRQLQVRLLSGSEIPKCSFFRDHGSQVARATVGGVALGTGGAVLGGVPLYMWQPDVYQPFALMGDGAASGGLLGFCMGLTWAYQATHGTPESQWNARWVKEAEVAFGMVLAQLLGKYMVGLGDMTWFEHLFVGALGALVFTGSATLVHCCEKQEEEELPAYQY